jgi:hypothetical protein
MTTRVRSWARNRFPLIWGAQFEEKCELSIGRISIRGCHGPREAATTRAFRVFQHCVFALCPGPKSARIASLRPPFTPAKLLKTRGTRMRGRFSKPPPSATRPSLPRLEFISLRVLGVTLSASSQQSQAGSASHGAISLNKGRFKRILEVLCLRYYVITQRLWGMVNRRNDKREFPRQKSGL